MFVYHTQVKLKDTDATGVLYFAEQFRMALEAFEAFLESEGFSLKQLLGSEYLMPVVHAEGDYFAPLTVGDRLEIFLRVTKVGTSSVTLQTIFYAPAQQKEVGKVEIVHVVVDREKRTAVPLPEFLKSIFTSALETAAVQPSSV